MAFTKNADNTWTLKYELTAEQANDMLDSFEYLFREQFSTHTTNEDGSVTTVEPTRKKCVNKAVARYIDEVIGSAKAQKAQEAARLATVPSKSVGDKE